MGGYGWNAGGTLSDDAPSRFMACIGRAPKNGSFGVKTMMLSHGKLRKPKALAENAAFVPKLDASGPMSSSNSSSESV